jgi:rubrerythrin
MMSDYTPRKLVQVYAHEVEARLRKHGMTTIDAETQEAIEKLKYHHEALIFHDTEGTDEERLKVLLEEVRKDAKDLPPAGPYRWACKKCGGIEVGRDAWAEWDVEKQDWSIVAAVYDDYVCENCGSDATIVPVALDYVPPPVPDDDDDDEEEEEEES